MVFSVHKERFLSKGAMDAGKMQILGQDLWVPWHPYRKGRAEATQCNQKHPKEKARLR
ncbi:hypothetical protein GCM10011405_07420 [Rufibacter glacialis]|nr:hypothetical protein GCM10011405_07420 [Rufibacter glacialis]